MMSIRIMTCVTAFTVLVLASATAQAPVTYVKNVDVTNAFARGAPLVEVEAYKVHASRRVQPGEAEIHERDTDIIYVLEGSATFVTGGTIVEPRTVATEEIRGKSIRGGSTTVLTKGDMMIVPDGTPHWFKEVQGPFLYYVVKVSRLGDRPCQC